MANPYVLIVYNSSVMQENISAFILGYKYPNNAMLDVAGLSTGDITTAIAEYDTDTFDAAFITCGVAAVAETKATAVVTVTGAGAEGDTVTLSIDDGETETTLGTYIVGATPSVTSVADGMEGVIDANFGGHGYTSNNVAGALTVTAPTGSGASVNGFILKTTIVGTVTVDDTTVVFAGGVTAKTTGNLTSTQKTAVDGKIDGSATSTVYTATSGGNKQAYNVFNAQYGNRNPTLFIKLLADASDFSDEAALQYDQLTFSVPTIFQDITDPDAINGLVKLIDQNQILNTTKNFPAMDDAYFATIIDYGRVIKLYSEL